MVFHEQVDDGNPVSSDEEWHVPLLLEEGDETGSMNNNNRSRRKKKWVIKSGLKRVHRGEIKTCLKPLHHPSD